MIGDLALTDYHDGRNPRPSRQSTGVHRPFVQCLFV